MDDWQLLKRLSEAYGPSTVEEGIIEIILSELSPSHKSIVTSHKNLIVFPEIKDYDKTIVFQAHMDELGLRPYRYHSNGFIELTPTGGIPREASNHAIVFQPGGINGILLIQELNKRLKYFTDVGAKDDKEAVKLVPRYANGAYTAIPMEASSTQLKGKSFDDRAGCSAIVSAMKMWDQSANNRIIGVFTAREETGNWPVTELYRSLSENDLLPDLIVNVECCPGGPTPESDIGMANLGEGIVLVNMDASYEPDPDLCRFMERVAIQNKIRCQHMAVRDGSGELGRLALGFGVAGYPLTIPCRYMHSPQSVISKVDYQACIQMIMEISRSY